jgi:hypothetical protein
MYVLPATVWSHNLFMDAAFVHGEPPALIIRINRAAEIIQIGATPMPLGVYQLFASENSSKFEHDLYNLQLVHEYNAITI